jgi:NAD-dependent dihydropyrimidine dehydrogenase PreA subunit
VIEVVSASRCIECDVCVKVCPTNVFDRGADGIPVIARQDDCQTCYMCEAYCPVDALFVAPTTAPVPAGSTYLDEGYLVETGLLGKYRHDLGWGPGRTTSATTDASFTLFADMRRRVGGPPPTTAPAPPTPVEPPMPAPA